MAEIVPATDEEFGTLARRGRLPSEEVVHVLGMEVGQVARIVNHEHIVSPVSPTCNLLQALHGASRRHAMQLAIRHDGADLLVKRLK